MVAEWLYLFVAVLGTLLHTKPLSDKCSGRSVVGGAASAVPPCGPISLVSGYVQSM